MYRNATVDIAKMVTSITEKAISKKGRGAERLDSMAQVISALKVDVHTIKSLSIDWRIAEDELLPILKMEFKEPLAT